MWFITNKGEAVNLTKCTRLFVLFSGDNNWKVYAEPIKSASSICLTDKFDTEEEAKQFIYWLLVKTDKDKIFTTWNVYKHTIIDSNPYGLDSESYFEAERNFFKFKDDTDEVNL